jgi:outer membrane protein TolC
LILGTPRRWNIRLACRRQARQHNAAQKEEKNMKRLWLFPLGLFLLGLAVRPAAAQTFPAPNYFHQFVTPPDIPARVKGPEGLRDYVVNGKLRLALADAVRLTLLNNTDIRVDRLQIEQARYGILSAYRPFDPMFIPSLGASRSTSPTTNLLQGASTLSMLGQQAQFSYAQTFQTGTQYSLVFQGSKSDTNSSYYFLNPYYGANLNISLTQPLLRNRGLFPNRAPIVIARRNLEQSEANFETQVRDVLTQAVGAYWSVVQARESLEVDKSSLAAAEASYKHDKRALELGALPPLDIYRSESEVAQRRVLVIQAEYTQKQAEDQFRQMIGADLDPYIRALDLELVEAPEPQGELLTVDAKTALEEAHAHRSELKALQPQLANDDTSIRLARNGLLPDLELGANYMSTGFGGNQLNSLTTPPSVIHGGFGNALSQLGTFGFPTYGFTLTLNLPVRDRAAQASLGRARVAKESDLYLLRRLEQAIILDVMNAVHQLEQAKLSLAASRIARDLAEKTVQAEQRKYELGAETVFFVLQAQSVLAQAELNVVQAEISYQLALTALDRATGTLFEKHQIQIADAIH